MSWPTGSDDFDIEPKITTLALAFPARLPLAYHRRGQGRERFAWDQYFTTRLSHPKYCRMVADDLRRCFGPEIRISTIHGRMFR